MNKWSFLGVSTVLFFIYGCGSVPFSEYKRDDRTYVCQMPKKIKRTGFYFPRPKEYRWFTNYYERKKDSITFFMYEKSETFDFKAEVKYIKLGKNPKTKQEFAEMVTPLKMITSDKSRYEIISEKTSVSERQGQWCFNYYVEYWDKKAPHYQNAKLKTILKGFVLKHLKPATAIEAYYRECGLPSEIDKEKNNLQKHADELLDSIIIVNDQGIQIN